MRARLAQLWAHHRIALLAFVVAIGALGFFGVRSLAATIYWMDPAHQEQRIKGWMTPRYVGQSYSIPRPVVEEALMFEKGSPLGRQRLSDIAAANGLTLDELQVRIDDATAAFRAEKDDKK